MITKKKEEEEKKREARDCSENILPHLLNHHDNTVLGCEVNFLRNYILFRGVIAKKHPPGKEGGRKGAGECGGGELF